MRKQLWLVALFVLLVGGLWAQDAPSTVTKTFAVQNVTIIPSPGKMIEGGTIVVKDGLIHAVGTNVKIPFDAKVIKADSMYVYAGFIDGASHAGIPKAEKKKGEEIKDPGNPPNDRAGIQPEQQVRGLLNANDKSLEDLRKLGFTAAHVVPRGKMLPGSGSLVALGGETANDMILKEDVSLFAQLKGAGRIYPATVIAVMSKMRDLYHQAEQAKAHSEAFAKNPNGMARPTSNPVLEAFYPAIDGKEHVYMAAPSVKDLSRALALQADLGYQLSLVDVKQAWHYADDLKNTPLFLSLNLPKAKEDKKEEEVKEGEAKEKTPAELEKERLEARSAAALKDYEGQAALLAGKDMQFGFTTLSTKSKDVKANILRLIAAGLTEQQALAALTTTPAKLFGADQLIGTVEKGKLASFFISDAPYFTKESNVRYVFVDGHLYEYEAKKKKKKSEGAADAKPADFAGKWSYSMNAMGQDMEGEITLKVDGDTPSGTITNPQSGEEGAMSDPAMEGNVLTFSISVQGMKVEFEVTFTGEELEGTVSVGSFGTFDMEGERLSKPK